MTETTRTADCNAGNATLMMACELGSTKWTLGLTTGPGQRPRLRTIAAGDLPTLEQEILIAQARFGLPLDAPVWSCYEAGRGGFGLHRRLIGHGVQNVVVDSSSIEVNRRARRAKTDRLDVGKLLALLLRWLVGERQVWSVVHVSSPEAEAQRQLTREIATVREDRKRVRNRIQSLLATQGIRLERRAPFVAHRATVQTGDGRPLPAAFCLRLEREWAHLDAIEARMTALTVARDEAIATGTDRVATIARQLCTMRGVAETSAAVFSAAMGLVPVPYRSDQRVRDQGISKAGRAELRRIGLPLAVLGALATGGCIDAVVSDALWFSGRPE